MNRSVVLGFSGGIDSCTAAQRLKDDGYRVIALTINTTNDTTLLEKAKAKAHNLGIEWMQYDAVERFRINVIEYFISSYTNGYTPAPCTRCNTLIKWQILQEVADSLNVYHIATGHYLNIVERGGHLYVASAQDSVKDQSYYLWGLNESLLRRILTPMGNILKSDIRHNFIDKSESMGICFLNGCHYSEFLLSEGVALIPGMIVDTEGNIVGRHSGIARYTIGQRRGEGIPEGLRIVDIDAINNRLIVGKNEMLYKRVLYINDTNVINHEEVVSANDITIKIRGIGRNPKGYVLVSEYDGGYRIECQDPAWAPAKGQPLVLYRNNLVIGGGIICDFN